MATHRNPLSLAPGVEAIPFNRPFVTGREVSYVQTAINSGSWGGGGPFMGRCEAFLRDELGLGGALLTTSCTHALELSALLLGIGPGDEVIVPSYTFVSTANAFALRGATIRFADSCATNPNMDPAHVRSLVTERTRCIVAVHYAGVACDMDEIMQIAAERDIAVVEDAAQAIGASHRGRPLGTIGRYGAISFHSTKNISAGEGGALLVRSADELRRAEEIREMGTNRSAFVRGEIDRYGWVRLGSSYVPSDLLAAVLLAQLESLHDVQRLRLAVWRRYHDAFAGLEQAGRVQRPAIPEYATNNAHMYYLICASGDERDSLREHLRDRGVQATSHYTPLHNSQYQLTRGLVEPLPHADRYHACLLRLPLFAALGEESTLRVIAGVRSFYSTRSG